MYQHVPLSTLMILGKKTRGHNCWSPVAKQHPCESREVSHRRDLFQDPLAKGSPHASRHRTHRTPIYCTHLQTRSKEKHCCCNAQRMHNVVHKCVDLRLHLTTMYHRSSLSTWMAQSFFQRKKNKHKTRARLSPQATQLHLHPLEIASRVRRTSWTPADLSFI